VGVGPSVANILITLETNLKELRALETNPKMIPAINYK